MARFSRRKFLSFFPLIFTNACGGGSNNGKAEFGGPENVVRRENAKAEGVTGDWLIPDPDWAGNQEIEGYASATSINRGEQIRLYVNTIDASYTISVYRIGWYGGRGGRLVAGPIGRSGIRQPAPAFDPVTGLVECDWTDPFVLSTAGNLSDPTDWASGFYLARLTGSSGKQSYIIFVVRDDARSAALLFQSSVTTYAAYNGWGGYGLYSVNSVGGKAATKVSFNRPYRNPQRPSSGKGAGDFLSWEIHMLRFLEREGYDVVYSTNIDTHASPNRLLKCRGFLSVGHDEYWTWAMRDAVEAARNRGVNLGFFGANAGYWQVRLEPNAKGQADRIVVGYKFTAIQQDPAAATDPPRTTYLWRDYPVSRPEASLVGVQYDYNSVDLDMVIGDMPAWIRAGTTLTKGSVLRGMLGYEVDRVSPTSSPAGIQVLASSPYEVCPEGKCTGEIRYANMSWYSHQSGAGVFAAGSMQWNWGLDNFGPSGERMNPAVQQVTRNVLNRFLGQSG
jgi:hypothetical protein